MNTMANEPSDQGSDVDYTTKADWQPKLGPLPSSLSNANSINGQDSKQVSTTSTTSMASTVNSKKLSAKRPLLKEFDETNEKKEQNSNAPAPNSKEKKTGQKKKKTSNEEKAKLLEKEDDQENGQQPQMQTKTWGGGWQEKNWANKVSDNESVVTANESEINTNTFIARQKIETKLDSKKKNTK